MPKKSRPARRTVSPEIQAFAKSVVQGKILTQEDLSSILQDLVQVLMETAMQAEMTKHLGYEKFERSQEGNSRNGYFPKTVSGSLGELSLSIPRDRQGDFEPQLIPKGKTRIGDIDQKILACYAKGMTTRDIADTFQEMFGVEVSSTLVSQVTEAVWEQVVAFQNRPLEALYPVVFLDGLVVKVHQNNHVAKMTVYVALAINLEGQKELLGLWLSETESASYWLSILNELKSRGVQDILIASVDGLSGFPEAIEAVYPQTLIQRCIVHLVRNALKYVSYKDRKELAQALKAIYAAPTAAGGAQALAAFKASSWGQKYPQIASQWEREWAMILPMYGFPESFRKVIYTTNTIESLNGVIRKAIKNRRIFPHPRSALKTVFLAIERASRRWTRPVSNWPEVLQFLQVRFGERVSEQLAKC